jgi:hypothetical protein
MAILIQAYQATDDDGAKALCRIPVSGNIVLSLEREPNYYAGAYLQCEEPAVYVCRDTETGRVCGLFNVGWRRVYVNGQVQRQQYFSDLRIDPDYQKSRLFFQIIRYAMNAGLIPKGETVAATIVFTDNTLMQTMIQKRQGNSRFPAYHKAGDYTTQIISLAARRNPFKLPPQYFVRKASVQDIPMMQAFADTEAPSKQAYPYYNYADLGKAYYAGLKIENYYLAFEKERLVGICAVWQQKAIKQTRIMGYSRLYALARPIANIWARLRGNITLPTEGSLLNYFYVHNVLVAQNEPFIFSALLHALYHDYRRGAFAYFMVGLFSDDALMTVFKTVKNKRTVGGTFYWVNDGLSPEAFLDGRQTYVEIGRI